MKLGNRLLSLGRALIGATMFAALPAAAQQRPNVVFILADNVGYGDMGPYGGGELRGYPTPRVDELAREGLHLTQFLVEPSCTPSRSALMTGQYSIRNALSLATIPGTPNTLSLMPTRWGSCSRMRATRRQSSASGTSAINRCV